MILYFFMKNVNLSLDEKTWRAARILAAQRDMSLSGLVREALQRMCSGEDVLSDPGGEVKQRERLVDLLEQCSIDLAERPTREASYGDRRFH